MQSTDIKRDLNVIINWAYTLWKMYAICEFDYVFIRAKGRGPKAPDTESHL